MNTIWPALEQISKYTFKLFFEGNWPFAANLKSWESLQVNQQRGGNEARAVLDEGELFLKKASEQLSDQYQGAKSMYLYAEGKIYYKSSHSDATQKNFYCHKALESLQQSLELTEKVYGKHTATARCLNEIGNCYNELQNLEMASTYFERAYKMREELSSSNGHNDMAVYLNQIAVIHEKTGVKLLKEKNTEDEGKRKLTKAIQLFQKALDLEKKLKIDGYSSTALFKRNMANAYLYLDEPEKAWKPALEAYEIRERVLGTHPDTVRSLFQLGNVKYWAEDYQAALEYFYKAYDMEESLPEGNHSAVRQLIKKRILDSGGTLKYGKMTFIILPNPSYDQALVCSGLQTLLERRGLACERFVQALHVSSSSCMARLLPERSSVSHGYDLRSGVTRQCISSNRLERTDKFISFKYV